MKMSELFMMEPRQGKRSDRLLLASSIVQIGDTRITTRLFKTKSYVSPVSTVTSDIYWLCGEVNNECTRYWRRSQLSYWWWRIDSADTADVLIAALAEKLGYSVASRDAVWDAIAGRWMRGLEGTTISVGKEGHRIRLDLGVDGKVIGTLLSRKGALDILYALAEVYNWDLED